MTEVDMAANVIFAHNAVAVPRRMSLYATMSVIDESQRLQIWHSTNVYQGPSSNPTRRKSGRGPKLAELPEIWGFSFNISATDEASDFTFGIHLSLLRPIIKSHPEEKWGWPWARGAPRNLGFPFNISATAKATDFKFGTQLGFANIVLSLG